MACTAESHYLSLWVVENGCSGGGGGRKRGRWREYRCPVPCLGCRWRGLRWGVGTARTPLGTVSQPRWGGPFRRSPVVRTCPTACVPLEVWQDRWDGVMDHPAPPHRGLPSSSSRSSHPACTSGSSSFLRFSPSRPARRPQAKTTSTGTTTTAIPPPKSLGCIPHLIFWLDAWIQVAFCPGSQEPWPAPGAVEVEVGVEGTGRCARLALTRPLAGLGGAPGASAAFMKPGQQPVTDHPRFRGGGILTSHARNNSTSEIHLIIHRPRGGSTV